MFRDGSAAADADPMLVLRWTLGTFTQRSAAAMKIFDQYRWLMLWWWLGLGRLQIATGLDYVASSLGGATYIHRRYLVGVAYIGKLQNGF